MSDKNTKSPERLEELQDDIDELKHTLSNDPGNAKRKVKYTFRKNLHWILLAIIIGMFGYFWLFRGITIPEWVYVVIAGMIICSIVLYPYAGKVADYFIEDTRKPVLEIDDGKTDFGVYAVPDERLVDIEFIDGAPREARSSEMGTGIQVREFETEEHEGREMLLATGTWEGSKSPLELKRDYSEIESMRDNLEKMARKGFLYDIKWPEIVHTISDRIVNEVVYEFQGISNYKGKEIQDEINHIVKEEKIEEQTNNDEEVDDENMEKLVKMMENGNFDNGENNG